MLVFSVSATSVFAQNTPSISLNLDSLKLPVVDPPRPQLQPDSLFAENIAKAETAASSLTCKIDSLRSLNLPTDKYRRKLDSLSSSLRNKILPHKQFDSTKLKLQNSSSKIRNAHDSLTAELEARRLALQKKIDQKTSFLDSLTNGLGMSRVDRSIPDPVNKLPNAQLPTTDLKMPVSKTPGDINLPGKDINLPPNPLSDIKTDVNTPDLKIDNPLNDINQKVTDIQDKPKTLIQNNDTVKGANDVKSKVQQVSNAAQKVEIYKEEISDIKTNGLSQADDLTKEAEKRTTEQIMKQDAMKELQAQEKNMVASRNMLEQYQDMLASMKDKKEIGTTAKDLASQHLDDPFAGKEDKLKAGVAQLDKLKKKYKTIPDSRYLPKRAPSEMKGKPLRERIVPGISFQGFKSDRAAIDFAPYVAYKLTGRFRPGIGASWRAAVWLKEPWIKKDEVYGFRAFNDFRLYSSFYFHTEGEWLHFSEAAKTRYKFPVDKDFGDWRFRVNAGLFRTYVINKRVNGQFQFLYNVADLKRFPQNRNTSIRFGFEYKFQPRKKNRP